jgi:hypothetical protein
MFGVDLSDMPELKESLGQAVVDFIVDRTKKGVDINGDKFDDYGTPYTESDAFKAFGKTKKVNLSLRGDMLSQLEVIESSGNQIKLGWEDPTENAKAYNHNTGDTVTKRQFFGIKDEDLKKISAEFKPDLKKSKNDETILNALDSITETFLKGFLSGKKD